jgi:hypothetical protein
MKEILLRILIIAYGGVGIMGLVAYWPTIKDLYYYKKASANVSSYILWVITTGIALLYGIFILPDILFIVVSGMNFIACIIVLFLSLGLKKGINNIK